MKTSVKIIAVAALSLFAASCSKERVAVVAEGEETVVNFTIASPVISTKAIADGNTVDKVDVNVYKADGTLITDDTITKTVEMSNGTATYSARLVTGQTYQFVFWAYNAEGNHYTLDAEAKTVTVNYEGFCNDESRDAFYKYIDAKKITGPLKETIMLDRPFAQLNFGVNEADIAAASAAGIEVKKSAVTLADVPNVLNLTDGSATGEARVVYTLADCPSEKLVVKGTEYGYVSMGYVLAGKGEEGKIATEVSLTIADEAGTELCEPKVVPAVPLQGNWRTNILGNLFTSDVEFTIIVEPSFENETVIDLENISTEAALKAFMLTGGSAVLASDINISDGNEIFVSEGKNLTLDLNGHNITNTVDIWFESDNEDVPNKVALFVVSGNLTIKGQGSVKAKENDCYTFDVEDGGHLVIEDGEYVGNISVIQVHDGLAEVKGGKFSLAQKWPTVGEYGCEYMINMIDPSYKDGTANAIVTGGEFVGFNPANNAAEGANTNFVADGYVAVQDGEVFTVVKGTAATVVSTADELDAAIENAADDETIYLKAGSYTNVIDVRGNKTMTFKPFNGAEVVIAGVNAASNSSASVCSFEDITFDNSLQTAGWFTGTGNNMMPCVGAWGGKLSFKNCKFIVEGVSAKETAVLTWWTLPENTCELNFNGCTFEGKNNHSEARAMQVYGHVDLTVDSCVLSTAKRYAVKYAGKEGNTAIFRNNNVSNCKHMVQVGDTAYPGSKYTVNFENNTLAEGIADYKLEHEENAVINGGIAE